MFPHRFKKKFNIKLHVSPNILEKKSISNFMFPHTFLKKIQYQTSCFPDRFLEKKSKSIFMFPHRFLKKIIKYQISSKILPVGAPLFQGGTDGQSE
jgi:hypothetical protein